MGDVDVDVGGPMSILIPACMHSIEPGLGILSARKGEEGASLSFWRWNGGVPFSYVRSPNPQTPPASSYILHPRSSRSEPLSIHACILSCLSVTPELWEVMLGNLSRLTG
jgi:hypothetical protein